MSQLSSIDNRLHLGAEAPVSGFYAGSSTTDPLLFALSATETFNVKTLDGTNGFRVVGHAGERIGADVAGAGDLNGDGFGDVLIAAPVRDGTHPDEVIVVFGHSGAFDPSISTSSLDGANGYMIQVPMGLAGGLFSDLSAGDFNGDGLRDIAVGAPWTAVDYQDYTGAAYVLFGHAGPFSPIVSAADLDGSDGFRIAGLGAQSDTGGPVSLAGDVNGDGLDDLIVGVRGASPHGRYSGAAYVIFGSRETFAADFDLTTVNGVNGFDIRGEKVDDSAGWGLSAAGDVNGDGYGDILIGAPGRDAGRHNNNGVAYVVYGHAGAFAPHFDLSDIDGANGFRINGDLKETNDFAGHSVAAAGDVNGDGFGDLFISASPNSDINQFGASYVVFGGAGLGPDISLGKLDGSDGFKLVGASHTAAGYTLASAGDINGDGFSDLIASAFGEPTVAYVLYGQAGGFAATVDLAHLAPNQGFAIVSGGSDRYVLHSVSGAGDVNGDGLDDLIVGTRDANAKGADSGVAYIIYGQQPDGPVTRTGTVASQHLVGGSFDDSLSGMAGDDQLFGNGGADTLQGGAGDDTVHGGEGEDAVVFSGDLSDYQITALSDGRARIVDLRDGSPDGTDLIDGAESFVFADVTRTASELFRTLHLTGGAADHRLVEAGLSGAGFATAETSGIRAPHALGSVSFDVSGWTRLDASNYSLAGVYGVARLNILSGVIFYTLDNQDADTQALALRQAATDDFTVTLYDQEGGLGSKVVHFAITGADDAPTVSGGQVITDVVEAGNAGTGVSTASAAPILIHDPDAGDAPSFSLKGWHRVGATDSFTHAGVYGTATLDIDTGVVSYALDNADRDTQALGEGETATDSFVLTVTDGHGGSASTSVVFTIEGAYDSPAGTPGADLLEGDGHDDIIDGGKGADTILGGDGDDLLIGGAGADSVEGGAGADTLRGGLGADRLAGGDGRDVFAFASVHDSSRTIVDRISDLTNADKIDLSAIDADTGSFGDQQFHLVGAFSHHATELTVSYDAAAGLTMVRGDVDGDGRADLVISIEGDHHSFTNFVL